MWPWVSCGSRHHQAQGEARSEEPAPCFPRPHGPTGPSAGHPGGWDPLVATSLQGSSRDSPAEVGQVEPLEVDRSADQACGTAPHAHPGPNLTHCLLGDSVPGATRRRGLTGLCPGGAGAPQQRPLPCSGPSTGRLKPQERDQTQQMTAGGGPVLGAIPKSDREGNGGSDSTEAAVPSGCGSPRALSRTPDCPLRRVWLPPLPSLGWDPRCGSCSLLRPQQGQGQHSAPGHLAGSTKAETSQRGTVSSGLLAKDRAAKGCPACPVPGEGPAPRAPGRLGWALSLLLPPASSLQGTAGDPC